MAETTSKVPVKTEKKSAPAPVGSWPPFESLRREVDRLFDVFGGVSFPVAFGRPAFQLDLPWPREEVWRISPAVDFVERDNEYEVTVELPGLSEKDVEVKLSNGNLMIKGEKKEEKEEKGKDYHVSERRFGSFVRSFTAPEGVDTSNIEATFANGVLTVKLPKTAEAQKSEKKIEIKTA